MAYVTSVPYQDPATGSFDVVSAVWPNHCDYTIYIPQFGDGVLDGNVGANSDLSECPCMLVVVVLRLFFVGDSVFLRVPSTCLPLWCEGSTMSRERILYWLAI